MKFRCNFVQTFLLLSVLVPTISQAQVYECNGTWTNQPCNGEPAKTLTGQPSIPSPAVTDPDRGAKRTIFHDLTMKSIRAKGEYDIKVDLSVAEKLCIKELAPLEACSNQAKADEDAIDEKIKSAESLRLEQKKIALQEEANKIQKERNKSENVNIRIDRRPIIIVRPDGSVDHQQYGGGAGIQVNGNVTTGSGTNGNISVTAGTGTVVNDGLRPYINPKSQNDLPIEGVRDVRPSNPNNTEPVPPSSVKPRSGGSFPGSAVANQVIPSSAAYPGAAKPKKKAQPDEKEKK